MSNGPSMRWYLYVGTGARIPLLPNSSITLGRSEECDVKIDNYPRISRQHLRIQISADGYQWTVNDLSANGTVSDHGRIQEISGNSSLTLLLGGREGPLVVLSTEQQVDLALIDRPEWISPREELRSSDPAVQSLTGSVRVGRDASNDVVVDSLLASPYHARIITEAGESTIVDLKSARGTFVNGNRVKQHKLTVGDLVRVGGKSFRFSERGTLDDLDSGGGVRVRAQELAIQAGNKILVSDVDVDIKPRSLVAIVGPSGSGKSTLLGALTGLRRPTYGTVLVDDQDLFASYDDWRFRIGYVPQEDLVPSQLTVRQALTYAARLRFPDDTSEDERQERITEVVDDLRLTGQFDLRIDRLSGGQRKRVSVALELLTKPPVLYLDEPTSGLDPGLDQQLMLLLRELADDGRTVIVVTHAMDNLHLCDAVAVLAAPGQEERGPLSSGGQLAFLGSPNDALEYFGVKDWPGVFLELEKRPAVHWSELFKKYQRAREYPQPLESSLESAEMSWTTIRQGNPFAQWKTLVKRTMRTTIADRSYFFLLLTLPIVLAALGFLVGSSAGLGPIAELNGQNPDARILLLVLILGASFTGAATTISEVVKERVIYRRERAVGMSSVAYITSKATVLGVIAALQGFVFAMLTLAGRPAAGNPLFTSWGHLDVAVIVALLAISSAMLGLAISTLIPSREGSLPILVIVTMVQVVLSGAIPLRWEFAESTVGLVIPAYWGFEALAAVTDLGSLIGLQGPEAWSTSIQEAVQNVAALGLLGLGFLGLATLFIRRSDPGK